MTIQPTPETSDQGEQDAPYPKGWRVSYVVGVLTLAWFIAYLDRLILGILVEPMRRGLSMTDTEFSLVQGFAFSVFFVLAGLPLGRLVDRTSRRNVLIFGVLCWCVATVACGLAQTFWQLFAARLVVGVGEACLAPASVSLIADLIPQRRRGLATGFMTGAQGVGNASAIFLGAFILQALGPYGGVRLPVFGYLAAWRLVFFIVGAPGFIVILLLLAVREPARRERAKREESKAFLPFLRRHSAAFTLTIASLTSTVLVNTGFATWIAAILMRIHHMPPAKIGVTLGPILLCVVPVCVMLGGAASDWLSRRVPSIGRLGVPLFAYPVLTLVHLIWWRVDSAAASLLGFTLSACVIHALISGTLYPALNQMVPNEMRGQTTTLMLVLLSILGYSISPTLVALLNDDFFKDPMMLRQSVALVGVPTGVLGFLFTLFALKPYRRACAETAALTAGS